MDELKRDFSVLYVCENCNKATPPPTHCGKAMQVEVKKSTINWICWKGEHTPCCGKESFFAYDNCCVDPNLVMQLQKVLV
ncbi:MAG: hypothetical protein HeimC2_03840 [Candidatus Heimdallarchaeota archaeon LC_2]|nr:MAG: hypothetical protein HeimC2_03840 [Candidatus Heimdallarchaeota archaeon LC_2]